jgi:CRP/FNR family transcriptional regulator
MRTLPIFSLSCRDCSLAELCLPRALDTEELEQLESKVKQHPVLARGALLYNLREPFHSLYVVKSGTLKTVINTASGKEQITGFFMPGEIVGFDGLDTGHTCSAVAIERTTVCDLPLAAMDDLTGAIPSLRREIFRLMSREITTDQSMLLTLARRSSEERIATFLMNLSERFRKRGFSAVQFPLAMARQDIGNYLGMAAETVSRVLTNLSDANLISVHGRVLTVLNPTSLALRAGQ